MHTDTDTQTHIDTHTHTHTHTIYMYVYMYVYIYVYIYVVNQIYIESSWGSVRSFKEQAKVTSFENVTCDCERRKKLIEKMLNLLTIWKRTPPPETDMTDLIPCGDNAKSNISSDTNYSNSNIILS